MLLARIGHNDQAAKTLISDLDEAGHG
jgi:hypothetical protein